MNPLYTVMHEHWIRDVVTHHTILYTCITLCMAQLHTWCCSRLTCTSASQIDPQSAYLREEFGLRAFFPDSNNEFHLPSCVGVTILSLLVEGSPPTTRPVHSMTASAFPPSTPGPSSASRPIFSSKKEISVVQATLKKLSSGKIEFTRENQTYVTVTEETANIDYISQAIQRKWGFHYVLVTSDGLKLDDSAQGVVPYLVN